jgi:hypothetical protein
MFGDKPEFTTKDVDESDQTSKDEYICDKGCCTKLDQTSDKRREYDELQE